MPLVFNGMSPFLYKTVLVNFPIGTTVFALLFCQSKGFFVTYHPSALFRIYFCTWGISREFLICLHCAKESMDVPKLWIWKLLSLSISQIFVIFLKYFKKDCIKKEFTIDHLVRNRYLQFSM